MSIAGLSLNLQKPSTELLQYKHVSVDHVDICIINMHQREQAGFGYITSSNWDRRRLKLV